MHSEETFELVPGGFVEAEKIERMFSAMADDLNAHSVLRHVYGAEMDITYYHSMSQQERFAAFRHTNGGTQFVVRSMDLILRFVRPSQYDDVVKYFADLDCEKCDGEDTGYVNDIVFEQRLDARMFLHLDAAISGSTHVADHCPGIYFDYVKFYNMNGETGRAAGRFISKVAPSVLKFADMFDFESDSECEYPASSLFNMLEFWAGFFETINCEELGILTFANEHARIPTPIFNMISAAIRQGRFCGVDSFSLKAFLPWDETYLDGIGAEVDMVEEFVKSICHGMPQLDCLRLSSWIHTLFHLRSVSLRVEYSITMAFLMYPRSENFHDTTFTYGLYFGHSDMPPHLEDNLKFDQADTQLAWARKIMTPIMWIGIPEKTCKKFHLELYVSSIERFLHLYKLFEYGTTLLPATISIYPEHERGYAGFENWKRHYDARLREMFQGCAPSKCWIKFFAPGFDRVTAIKLECSEDEVGGRKCIPRARDEDFDRPAHEAFLEDESGDVSFEGSDNEDEDAMDEVAEENEVEFWEGDDNMEEEGDDQGLNDAAVAA